MRRLDDRRLVQELRARCPAALEEVDRRYRPRLRAHGARMLRGTGHDPEDVVQDTLLRAWTALPVGDEDEVQLDRWLHTVLRNRALDVRRRQAGRNLPLTDEPDERRGDVARQVLDAEELRETVDAVTALPPRQREAIVRHAIDGESHVCLARRMHTTESATKLLVMRARTRLREQRRLR